MSSLHTQIAQDRESLRLIESVDDSWSTFDDDTWPPSFTTSNASSSSPIISPTATRSSRRRSSRCKDEERGASGSASSSPWNGTGRSSAEEERRNASKNMHIPSPPATMLIHSSVPKPAVKQIATTATTNAATSFSARRSTRLAQCLSDDTPVMSNVVEPILDPSAGDGDVDDEVSALVGRRRASAVAAAAEDPTSSSNEEEEEDDLTVSRINVSDTDLLRSESPGCIRLTEHGLKAFEEQQQNAMVEEPAIAAVTTPRAFTAGRMRHVHPRRPRPLSSGDPKASGSPSSSYRERRASHNDGSSRVLEPCPEDCATTYTQQQSPPSSPQQHRQKRGGGGGLLSSLRGRRGADEGDASSVTPLCDSDKLVSMPPTTLVVSDTPSTLRRRRFFGLVRGARCGGSNDDKEGWKKSGKNQPSSSKSTASQKFLEQVSAQEAKERQKMAEERERRRIEQKRRAYLQQQRAKEMAKKRGDDDDEDAMTRPSSSRTAVTAQSSLFDDDSLLLRGSRGSGRSSAGRPNSSSKSMATNNSSRRESGMFREFGEFLFADACPGTFSPEDGSIASSTAMTTAPNTHSHDGRTATSAADASQVALLPACVVCRSAERTHVATPCFHFLYCAKCSRRLPACLACHQPAQFRPINM